MLMTCLRANRDLLMSMLYLASFPSVPVIPILSEPAKSTSWSLLVRVWEGLPWGWLSTLMVRMEWLREETELRRWEQVTRFCSPNKKYLMSSCSFLHWRVNRFYTMNY
jgi:hypothetical protein